MITNPTTVAISFVLLMTCSPLRGQDDRFVVFEGGKHGYINQEGMLVIPAVLEGTYVIAFSEGRAMVAEAVKPKPLHVPYVDEKGKVRWFPEEKWGFIDMNGAVAVPVQFDAAQSFSEGLAGVAFDTDRTSHSCTDCDANQHWGFIDKQGKMIVQTQYHWARSIFGGIGGCSERRREMGLYRYEWQSSHPFSFSTCSELS